MSTKQTRVSWDYLDHFCYKGPLTVERWQPVIQLQRKAPIKELLERYIVLAERWEKRMVRIGGDPTRMNWESFRMLRLSREEDWSDWLGWLLETSRYGILLKSLFPLLRTDNLNPPKVKRETWTADGSRRPDLLLVFENGLRVHVEVKIEDKQFEKTFETALKLERDDPKAVWHHFILLPEGSVDEWNLLCSNQAKRDEINVLLWSDVSIGLRRSLLHQQEPIFWEIWAWTFCGAIEQKLLQLSSPNRTSSNPKQLDILTRWLTILDDSYET